MGYQLRASRSYTGLRSVRGGSGGGWMGCGVDCGVGFVRPWELENSSFIPDHTESKPRDRPHDLNTPNPILLDWFRDWGQNIFFAMRLCRALNSSILLFRLYSYIGLLVH